MVLVFKEFIFSQGGNEEETKQKDTEFLSLYLLLVKSVLLQ